MKAAEIRARLKSTGRTQVALGKAIGKSKDSVNRLLNDERKLEFDEAEKIRAFFGDDAEAGPAFEQIPVFGYAAAGGDDRVSLASDHVLEHIEVPRGLVRGAAMGIRVAGESMEPRLYAGERVIIGLGVPPTRGGDCVVELIDDTALVKQYQGQRDGTVFLRQLNPDKEIRIPATQVRSIRAVQWRR